MPLLRHALSSQPLSSLLQMHGRTYMRIRCLDTHDLAQLTCSPYEACRMMQIQQPPLLACQWVTFSAERASWVAHFFLNDAILKILSYWPRIFAGTPVLNMARGIYTYAHIMKYTIKYVDSLQIRHCLCRLGHLHRVLARRADVETVESLPWLFLSEIALFWSLSADSSCRCKAI